MASFISDMRMNTLYPTEYYNPKLQFELRKMQDEEQMRRRLMQNQPPIQPEPPAINPQLMSQLQKPMNVVLGDQGNPQGAINAAEDRIYKMQHGGLNPKEVTAQNAVTEKQKTSDENLGFKYNKLNVDTGFKYTKQDQDTKIRQQRADIYKYKAEHPEEHLIFPKGGNVMSVHPITHKVTDLGIDNGTLSDQDRIDLQQSNAIQSIEERGNQQRQTNTESNAQKLEGQKSLIETRQELQKPKELVPTQTRAQQQNKAETLFNTHPEWQAFIKILPNHTGFNVMPPGTNGLDEATFHQINNEIYNLGGKDIPLKPDTKTSDTKKPSTKKNDPLGIR